MPSASRLAPALEGKIWPRAARPVQAIAGSRRTVVYPKTDGFGYGQTGRGKHGGKPAFNGRQRGGFVNTVHIAVIKGGKPISHRSDFLRFVVAYINVAEGLDGCLAKGLDTLL